jgi:predicted Zn-dependent peptidase
MAMEDAGVSIAFGIANSGVDPMEVEKGMDAVIENAAAGLMDDMEFQKLKNQVENDIVTNNETILGRAENLANYKMYFGDANLINAEIDRYLKVTREDIQRVAKTYFNKNNRVVIYYLPKAAQP